MVPWYALALRGPIPDMTFAALLAMVPVTAATAALLVVLARSLGLSLGGGGMGAGADQPRSGVEHGAAQALECLHRLAGAVAHRSDQLDLAGVKLTLDRPIQYRDVLATLYHNIGIDIKDTPVRDSFNKPNWIMPETDPIAELV